MTRTLQILLLGLLCACQGLERFSDEFVNGLAADVEKLVAAGERDTALALIDSALASAEGDPQLHFIKGWYYDALAEDPSFDQLVALRSAERSYARAVELEPGYVAAIYNWTLVLSELEARDARRERKDGTLRPLALETIAPIAAARPLTDLGYRALLLQGDLLALDSPTEALETYAVAELERPAESAARNRRTVLLINLVAESPPGGERQSWVERLWEASQRDLAEGFHETSVVGHRFLIGQSLHDAERALLGWLVSRASLGALIRLDLPKEEIRAAQDNDAIGDPLPTLEDLCDDATQLARELREEPRFSNDFWMQTPERQRAISIALHAAARHKSLMSASDTDPEDGTDPLAEAVEILVAGVEVIAPDGSPVELDIALDLLLIYHAEQLQRGDAATSDGSEDKRWKLLQEPPLKGLSDPERWDAVGAVVKETGKDLARIHKILGLVYSEAVGWKSMAQLHLERSRGFTAQFWEELRDKDDGGRELRLARARQQARGVLISEEFPSPDLAEQLADGLAETLGSFDLDGPELGGAGGAYLKAAHGYIEGGKRAEAERLHTSAREARDLADARFYDLEQVLYHKYGWYLGLSNGYAIGGSAKALRQTLELQGHSIDDLTLSDPEAGLRVAGGYRFRGPWAVEFAYVDLGEYQSEVVTSSSAAQVARALEREHPLTGVGVSAMLKNFVYDRDRFGIYAKAGLWLWEADLEVAEVNGTSVRVDEAGIDPVIGVGAQYRIAPRVFVRGEIERYYLDDDEVDFITVGIQFNLGR